MLKYKSVIKINLKLNFLVQLKIYSYFKNMVEGSISQEFRFKDIDETQINLLKK